MTTTEAPPEAPPVPVVDPFPVDSFKDAAIYLRRPFTRNAIRFKVQMQFPKANPSAGLIVAYIDARLVVDRLNRVLPHLWFDEYDDLGNGMMICRLTVDGITRRDVGQGQGKGLYSDALKRAAVKFGIGVSLYAIPKMILKTEEGWLERKGTQEKPVLRITAKGEAHLRDMYEMWLEGGGSQAFGPPLDHGDAQGSQGDPYDADEQTDDEEATVGEVLPPAPQPAEPTIGPDRAATLAEQLEGCGTLAQARLHLAAVGVVDTPNLRKSDLETAAANLTEAQADKLEPRLRFDDH